MLKAENPNQHTSIFYEQDGDASLSFKQKEIAVGKYPPFNQSPKNSNTFKIVLHGSNTALPKEIDKGLNSTNSKARISLSLWMNASFDSRCSVKKCSCTFSGNVIPRANSEQDINKLSNIAMAVVFNDTILDVVLNIVNLLVIELSDAIACWSWASCIPEILNGANEEEPNQGNNPIIPAVLVWYWSLRLDYPWQLN
ncbi:unnamed protein product [Ilex paraguariensis]|uniref:Late embryogenesis abundant protein LEA-2 subgroup domain-containing protein n=1 Tax=Ilex paraguariensis TaxID=185542 RepID=A0ABC8SAN2_9AQUA